MRFERNARYYDLDMRYFAIMTASYRGTRSSSSTTRHYPGR
jgi:hypothetical protein